jgi:putative adenylate-forming enzyme
MHFKIRVIVELIKIRFARYFFTGNVRTLQRYRWGKFQDTLKISPFYRKYAIQNKSLDSYPIINKEIFMFNFDNINTCGIHLEDAISVASKAEKYRDFSPTFNEVTVGLSSGTSGNRGVFLASERERAQWVACVLDRVIGISLKKRRVAFFLRANSNLYSSVQSKILEFEFFDLLDPLESLMQRLQNHQPHILVGQPSLLIEIAKKMKIDQIRISPEKVFSVAEVLTPEDSRFLQEVFGQTIHQVYQCTEGLLATTCEYGTLHFNEDFLIIEKKYIDESKTRFHPIITDLKRSSQPVVRYELNDIIHEKKNCLCGSSFLGIASIEGRSDDILNFVRLNGDKVGIFPDFFRNSIILSDKRISDYTLVQTSTRKLSLYVGENREVQDKSKQAILDLLEKFQITDVEIVISEKIHHIQGTKLRRIRNDIK